MWGGESRGVHEGDNKRGSELIPQPGLALNSPSSCFSLLGDKITGVPPRLATARSGTLGAHDTNRVPSTPGQGFRKPGTAQ